MNEVREHRALVLAAYHDVLRRCGPSASKYSASARTQARTDRLDLCGGWVLLCWRLACDCGHRL